MGILRNSLQIIAEALPVLLLSLFGTFFAGVVLSSAGMRTAFAAIPGLLVVLPGFLATRGNVHGALGSRISTALHQGVITPRIQYDERLANAIVAATINGLAVTLYAGCAGWALLRLLGKHPGSLATLLSVLLLAALVSSLTLTFILIGLLFVGFRRGFDPDLLNGPLITSLGDFVGMLILYASTLLVGWFM